VSSDTATLSSGVEAINVDEDEEDAKSPDVVTVSPTETPHKVAATEERATETSLLTVDFGTPSYELTVNICTYLIF
jgi:hypothetical protein